MGMFDDLENFLDKNRKPSKEKKDNRVEGGLFDDLSLKGTDGVIDLDNTDVGTEIANLLEKQFGGKAKIVAGGKMITHEVTRMGGNHDDIFKAIEHFKDKLDELAKMTIAGFKEAGLKPRCNDANDKPLKDGDYLQIPGGFKKRVLEVGFGYSILSHTEDMAKDDGVWFEKEIKERGFIKK